VAVGAPPHAIPAGSGRETVRFRRDKRPSTGSRPDSRNRGAETPSVPPIQSPCRQSKKLEVRRTEHDGAVVSPLCRYPVVCNVIVAAVSPRGTSWDHSGDFPKARTAPPSIRCLPETTSNGWSPGDFQGLGSADVDAAQLPVLRGAVERCSLRMAPGRGRANTGNQRDELHPDNSAREKQHMVNERGVAFSWVTRYPPTGRHCTHCKRWLPFSAFRPNLRLKSG
jgi:hypothetical protein